MTVDKRYLTAEEIALYDELESQFDSLEATLKTGDELLIQNEAILKMAEAANNENRTDRLKALKNI